MHIELVDINHSLITEWKYYFKDCNDVNVRHGSIFDSKADAIVSAANSFLIMDGGLDGLYSRRWPETCKYLKDSTHQAGISEVLVGQVVYVGFAEECSFKHMIAAPTMRVPYSISETPNVYLAFSAVLKLAKVMDWSVACPGLGTGTGQVSPTHAAYQMRLAYDHVIKDDWQDVDLYNMDSVYNFHRRLANW